jgi:hypothetical protein
LIEAHLSVIGFTAQDLRALLRTNEPMMIESRKGQLVLLIRHVSSNYFSSLAGLSAQVSQTHKEENNHVSVLLPHVMNANQNNAR